VPADPLLGPVASQGEIRALAPTGAVEPDVMAAVIDFGCWPCARRRGDLDAEEHVELGKMFRMWSRPSSDF